MSSTNLRGKRRRLVVSTDAEFSSVRGLLPSESQWVETRTAYADAVRPAPEYLNSRKRVADPFGVAQRQNVNLAAHETHAGDFKEP